MVYNLNTQSKKFQLAILTVRLRIAIEKQYIVKNVKSFQVGYAPAIWGITTMTENSLSLVEYRNSFYLDQLMSRPRKLKVFYKLIPQYIKRR